MVEELTGDDRFLILACDGIWDCLKNEECVETFESKMKDRKPDDILYNVIDEMFEEIIAEDPQYPPADKPNNYKIVGNDNMTCLLVEFKH